MKRELTFLLMLSVVAINQAWAHPKDSDPVWMLPLGTRWVVNRDINIRPHTGITLILAGEVVDNFPTAACFGDLVDGAGIELAYILSDYDRVLRRGSALILRDNCLLWDSCGITSTNKIDRAYWRRSHLRVDAVNPQGEPLPSIKFFTVVAGRRNFHECTGTAPTRPASIGELRKSLGDLFELKFPEPSEM
jgi:hypothetical protein